MPPKQEADHAIRFAKNSDDVWNAASAYLQDQPGLLHLLLDLQIRLQNVEDHLKLDPDTGETRKHLDTTKGGK